MLTVWFWCNLRIVLLHPFQKFPPYLYVLIVFVSPLISVLRHGVKNSHHHISSRLYLYFLYHLYICICIHPFICILFSSEDVTEQPSSCLPVHPPPRPCPLSSTHLLLRVVFLLYFLVFLACLFRLVSVLYFFQMTTTTTIDFDQLVQSCWRCLKRGQPIHLGSY